MNKRDQVYFWYFLVHIPVTVMIDLCLVIPKEARWLVQNAMVDFHVDFNSDFLLKNPPLWLQAFGVVELAFQLPFFFVAAWALYHGLRRIWVAMCLYGFNASLTTAVCIAYVYAEGAAHELSPGEIKNLASLYCPYFFLPLFMMIDMAWRINSTLTTQPLPDAPSVPALEQEDDAGFKRRLSASLGPSYESDLDVVLEKLEFLMGVDDTSMHTDFADTSGFQGFADDTEILEVHPLDGAGSLHEVLDTVPAGENEAFSLLENLSAELLGDEIEFVEERRIRRSRE